jgi:hypothetical protein
LAVIALLAAVAPLFIWRGVNRTNRLLALHLERLSVDPATIRAAWYSGGSELPGTDQTRPK